MLGVEFAVSSVLSLGWVCSMLGRRLSAHTVVLMRCASRSGRLLRVCTS